MSGRVIVDDHGFRPVPQEETFAAPEDLGPDAVRVDLAQDADPAPLAPRLDRIEVIRIAFPAFSDGRGFTLARTLRRMGYRGTLRAAGHVIADQYPMARRSGFDEVEIDAALALRQPEHQWRPKGLGAGAYQDRLRARAS